MTRIFRTIGTTILPMFAVYDLYRSGQYATSTSVAIVFLGLHGLLVATSEDIITAYREFFDSIQTKTGRTE